MKVEKVEVQCPLCGSRQRESASGLSTICRACGGYFKLEGAGPLGSLKPLWPFRRQREEAPRGLDLLPPPELNIMEQLSAAPRRKERREVICYECRASQRVSASAGSTLCGNCGTWIDLRDVEVRERVTGRVRTRGDVTVHKKGALLGTAVHCGNLTLQGQFTGSVYAQDTVTFRTGMRMLGEVRCRRLVVERRCGVRFLQPVHAEEIEILGEVAGNFFVSGRAEVGRHGSLEGMLNTRLLHVEHGGELNGPVMAEGAAGVRRRTA